MVMLLEPKKIVVSQQRALPQSWRFKHIPYFLYPAQHELRNMNYKQVSAEDVETQHVKTKYGK